MPLRWESILCFHPSPLSPHSTTLTFSAPCLAAALPTAPVLPSRQLSAYCLGFLVPIRPIASRFHQTQHLSYHCFDNCLLVPKSPGALCSHGDDMATLPGCSEPPAEEVDPFPLRRSPCTSLCPPFSPPLATAPDTPPTLQGCVQRLGNPTLSLSRVVFGVANEARLEAQEMFNGHLVSPPCVFPVWRRRSVSHGFTFFLLWKRHHAKT